jgi:hypothetical protein
MVKQILIGYNAEREYGLMGQHEAWERVVNKYHALSIGSEKEGREWTSTLIFPKSVNLEVLTKELVPIKILAAE